MSLVGFCLCAALPTCLKTSPSLPPIDGSLLKELVMTSRGRRLCKLVSHGIWCSADGGAFRAGTDVTDRKVAITTVDADIQCQY